MPLTTPSARPSTPKSHHSKKERDQAVWTTPRNRYLVTLLEFQKCFGRRPDNRFKPEAWNQVVNQFNEKFRCSYSKDQIQDHFRWLKTQFFIVRDIQNYGFYWNDEESMVIIDDPQSWVEYLKAHPKAKGYRHKPFPLYDRLDRLVGDSQPTGRHRPSPKAPSFGSISRGRGQSVQESPPSPTKSDVFLSDWLIAEQRQQSGVLASQQKDSRSLGNQHPASPLTRTHEKSLTSSRVRPEPEDGSRNGSSIKHTTVPSTHRQERRARAARSERSRSPAARSHSGHTRPHSNECGSHRSRSRNDGSFVPADAITKSNNLASKPTKEQSEDAHPRLEERLQTEQLRKPQQDNQARVEGHPNMKRAMGLFCESSKEHFQSDDDRLSAAKALRDDSNAAFFLSFT